MIYKRIHKIVENFNPSLLEQLLRDSEKQTDYTLVPMVITQSASYPLAHMRAGILAILAVNPVAYFWSGEWHFLPISFTLQVMAFTIAYLLAYRPIVKRAFTTNKELQQAVSNLAISNLDELQRKHDRPIAFTLISLLEKKVEILLSPTGKLNLQAREIEQLKKQATNKLKKGLDHTLNFIINDLKERLANDTKKDQIQS